MNSHTFVMFCPYPGCKWRITGTDVFRMGDMALQHALMCPGLPLDAA